MKEDRLYLGHIVEAVDRIMDYAKAGEENFKSDLKTQDAIKRHLPPLREQVRKLLAQEEER